MKGSVITCTLAASTSLMAVVGASTEGAWPHPVPCRIRDGANPELIVVTLGAVDTPLAQGTFDPVADQVILDDGATLKNYYRDMLGVKNYTLLDKSHYPLPPSGWCT